MSSPWDHRTMPDRLDVLLLLALPASGKSEVRRYLDHLDPATAAGDMGLGPTVQLDDYPYVHLMRRISEELATLDAEPVFFTSSDAPWNDPRDWLTLIQLLNQDFATMATGGGSVGSPSDLLDRFDEARSKAAAPAPFARLDRAVRQELEKRIAPDVAALDPIDAATPDSTIVIEFARGGSVDVGMPLPYPLGYASSIAALDEAILRRSAILYVWVDPSESRRRNRERTRPGPSGDASILHHGVPETVMTRDYGTDDLSWLETQSRRPGTIPIGDFDIPIQRFDNRTDHTSFLRADPADWPQQSVDLLHRSLGTALRNLVQAT
jgi:hypothetical protein